MTIQKKDWKNMLTELEIKLEEIFTKKLWTLPKKAKEVIVTVAPYLAIISLIAIIPMIFSLIGLTFLTPVVFFGGAKMGFGYMVSIVVSLMMGFLVVLAIPGLFKKQIKGWKILFWMTLINAVGGLLRMDLDNLIIGTALSWYILFQVKEYYK